MVTPNRITTTTTTTTTYYLLPTTYYYYDYDYDYYSLGGLYALVRVRSTLGVRCDLSSGQSNAMIAKHLSPRRVNELRRSVCLHVLVRLYAHALACQHVNVCEHARACQQNVRAQLRE